MARTSKLALISTLILAVASQAQAPMARATVHLKILHAGSGEDLGVARISFFKSATGQDYAKQFRENLGTNIPYGIYHLGAYQDGFWRAERQVVVLQPEVWVVMGLHIGMEHELTPFKLSGSIRHFPPSRNPVWVRLTGVHSTLVMDAKVDERGEFLMTGLLREKCVLTVWSGTKILDVRPVSIPTDAPLIIDLASARD